MKDFFVSYSSSDMAWADWLAWELDVAGYDVIMQRSDFEPGANFVHEMDLALEGSRRLLLVLSKDSLNSKFVGAEWAACFAQDPAGVDRKLVPVRIDGCQPSGLLGQVVYIDLHGADETTARERLLVGIKHHGTRLVAAPVFPGLKAATTVTAPIFPAPGSPREGTQISPLDHYLRSARGRALPTIRRRTQGRAFVLQHLPHLIESMLDHARRVAVITIDVDGMTMINKRYGLVVGDAIIERLLFFIEELKDRILAVRMGDDTFCVVVQNQDERSCLQEAENLVERISEHDWDAIADGLFVHCSAGAAQFSTKEPPLHTLQRAIDAQRQARRKGGKKAETAQTEALAPNRVLDLGS